MEQSNFSISENESTKHLSYFLHEIQKVPNYVFTVFKWQSDDIIPDFSDIDLRIIVNIKSENDVLSASDLLYSIYKSQIGSSIKMARIFEHPANIIGLEELEAGFYNPNEIATWTFVEGDYLSFQKIVNRVKSEPFSSKDVSFYRMLLSSKRYYDINNETIYSHLGIERFKKYCLAWRYYATSLYAFASLISKQRMHGKAVALQLIKERFPLEFCNKKKLMDNIESPNVMHQKFNELLRNEWNYIFEKAPSTKIQAEFRSDFTMLKAYLYGLIIFRNKLSRLRLYLNPDYRGLSHMAFLENNLIKREIEDLFLIYQNFNTAIDYFASSLHGEYNSQFQEVLLKMNKFKYLLTDIHYNWESLQFSLSFANDAIVTFEKLRRFLLDYFIPRNI